MKLPDENAPLVAPLVAVQGVLERLGERGLIIGGTAASLLGRPRGTLDVDAMVLLSFDDLPRLMEAAAAEGLMPRIADAEAFAHRSRVVLLRHGESGIDVDISLGALPFEEEAMDRGMVLDLPPLRLRVPTPEDLIIMKAVAHRPVDLQDIEAIVETNPDLDRARVKYWVQQFAEALEMPELWDDIAHWFETPTR